MKPNPKFLNKNSEQRDDHRAEGDDRRIEMPTDGDYGAGCCKLRLADLCLPINGIGF
jgi:hypothetical protein